MRGLLDQVRVLCAAAALWAVPAQATDAPVAPAESAKPGKKPTTAKPKVVRPTSPGGSGETAAERSARLKRECKGRPNAGACTGYAN